MDGESPTSTLTDEERAFLLMNVVPCVPTEKADFDTTLTAVTDGHCSPASLNLILSKAVREEESTRDWTEVMMRTHVSGVVSRMVDLALLRRIWEGRRVTYELGPMSAIFRQRVLDEVD